MKICKVRVLDASEEKLKKLCLLVSSEKRYRIERFIKKEDKLRVLIGEILSRRMIAEELGISVGCIEFEKNKYGKLYLKYFPKLDFNISHSGDFVVCAMDNNPIGIDVEKIKYIEYEKIAKEFFSKTKDCFY